jgi:hypothetical protein
LSEVRESSLFFFDDDVRLLDEVVLLVFVDVAVGGVVRGVNRTGGSGRGVGRTGARATGGGGGALDAAVDGGSATGGGSCGAEATELTSAGIGGSSSPGVDRLAQKIIPPASSATAASMQVIARFDSLLGSRGAS